MADALIVFYDGEGPASAEAAMLEGSGDATIHGNLAGRTASDQHPIEAISGLRNAIDTINGTLTSQKTAIDYLAEQVNRLEPQNVVTQEELEEVRETLSDQVAELEAEVTELDRRVGILETLVDPTGSVAPTLRAELDSLELWTRILSDVTDMLEIQVAELEQQVSDLLDWQVEMQLWQELMEDALNALDLRVDALENAPEPSMPGGSLVMSAAVLGNGDLVDSANLLVLDKRDTGKYDFFFEEAPGKNYFAIVQIEDEAVYNTSTKNKLADRFTIEVKLGQYGYYDANFSVAVFTF